MSSPEVSLVSSFVSGMSCWKLNPDDHLTLTRHVEEILAIFRDLLAERPLVITLDDNSMRFNEILMPINSQDTKRLFLRFSRKKITQIIISKDIQAEEVRRFLLELASSGDTFSAYSRISVKVNPDKLQSDTPSGVQLLKDDLYHIRRIYRDISVYKSINMTRVDAIVGNIMANIRGGKLMQNMLLPLQSDNDDLYVHSANVALLSIFQAEYLGLGNALLHDIGLAALLHDAGKTMLPKSIAERQYSLNAADWEVIRRHTLYGAALLSSLSNIPDVAIVVAYEHHMKYDGTGYPETRRRAKKQHLISQIVAIADFYCALNSSLPHRKPLPYAAIISLLAEKAGKDFNPLLVANFVREQGRFSG
ncbi:MAG: HD domain-containing protein [Nitrospirota bacterium]|nr:HD domain-containing protein [Nitrospirota bacterium]